MIGFPLKTGIIVHKKSEQHFKFHDEKLKITWLKRVASEFQMTSSKIIFKIQTSVLANSKLHWIKFFFDTQGSLQSAGMLGVEKDEFRALALP